MEKWCKVVGYEDVYQVSNRGRVKSLPRTRKNKTGESPVKERIMRPSPVGAGYLSVKLSKNGKIRGWYIHHLVWLAFRGPIPKGFEINHKDGIKANCRLKNLELKTHKGNIKHAIEMGLCTIHGKGEANGAAVLTKKVVLKVREKFAGGVGQSKIASQLGLTKANVHLIVRRKTWSHI
jgi:hypothetical protein